MGKASLFEYLCPGYTLLTVVTREIYIDKQLITVKKTGLVSINFVDQ